MKTDVFKKSKCYWGPSLLSLPSLQEESELCLQSCRSRGLWKGPDARWLLLQCQPGMALDEAQSCSQPHPRALLPPTAQGEDRGRTCMEE